MKIAIIGSGAAGLSTAYALSQHHEIQLFEADSRIGGHAHTVDIPAGPTTAPHEIAVDTGFIVYNEHNYPNFIHMMDILGVKTEQSDMSFSVSIGTGQTHGSYEYLGEPFGLFAQKRNLLRPNHWAMIRDLLKFYKQAPDMLHKARAHNWTLGDMIEAGSYSHSFTYRHMLPMAAAIWSTPVKTIRDFPAETFINFFTNHRLFETNINARPIWRTISGGSRAYVEKIIAPYKENIQLSTPVLNARRTPQSITLTLGGDTQSEVEFNQIVFACHPDQALKIIGDNARPGEREVLGAIKYTNNHAFLHQDLSLMPKRRKAWSSWNYMATRDIQPHDIQHGEDMGPVALSYWMNQLQNLETKTPLILTLNPVKKPDMEKTFGHYQYSHPLFDKAALKAQKKLHKIQGADRFWFCGAWAGYGFHEDAMSAGLAVAKSLGAPISWADDITEMSPAAHHINPLNPSTLHAAE